MTPFPCCPHFEIAMKGTVRAGVELRLRKTSLEVASLLQGGKRIASRFSSCQPWNF